MSHLRKKLHAQAYVGSAVGYMLAAIDQLDSAERQLKLSGYSGPERGVRKANQRVKLWLEAVYLELKEL